MSSDGDQLFGENFGGQSDNVRLCEKCVVELRQDEESGKLVCPQCNGCIENHAQNVQRDEEDMILQARQQTIIYTKKKEILVDHSQSHTATAKRNSFGSGLDLIVDSPKSGTHADET
jgi:hypothetical protein